MKREIIGIPGHKCVSENAMRKLIHLKRENSEHQANSQGRGSDIRPEYIRITKPLCH